MRFKLENKYLPVSITLLEGMELVGADSRARTRLIGVLRPALEACATDEQALLGEFVEMDDQGQPLKDETYPDTLVMKPGKTAGAYHKAHDEFLSEKAVIAGGTYEGHREKIINVLENWDKPLSGKDAEVYDALLTALEEGED